MCTWIYNSSSGQSYSVYTLNFCKKCKAEQEKINAWAVPKTSNFKLYQRKNSYSIFHWISAINKHNLAQLYSLSNMRQLHILFNSSKTWHVIVCWFLFFSLNLLNLKLFCSDVQTNFRFSSGKFGGKHRNRQTITGQVLAELNLNFPSNFPKFTWAESKIVLF